MRENTFDLLLGLLVQYSPNLRHVAFCMLRKVLKEPVESFPSEKMRQIVQKQNYSLWLLVTHGATSSAAAFAGHPADTTTDTESFRVIR